MGGCIHWPNQRWTSYPEKTDHSKNEISFSKHQFSVDICSFSGGYPCTYAKYLTDQARIIQWGCRFLSKLWTVGGGWRRRQHSRNMVLITRRCTNRYPFLELLCECVCVCVCGCLGTQRLQDSSVIRCFGTLHLPYVPTTVLNKSGNTLFAILWHVCNEFVWLNSGIGNALFTKIPCFMQFASTLMMTHRWSSWLLQLMPMQDDHFPCSSTV